MASGLLVAVLLAAPGPAADVAPPVRVAVDTALALEGARAEVVDLAGSLPSPCALARAEVQAPIAASGRVAMHLFGADAGGRACEAWAWARVRVRAPSLVTTRALADGDALDGAVAPMEREVQPGRPPLPVLPEGAIAARALPAGAAVADADIRVGARPGETVAVVLREGALTIEQEGRAIACRRGRVCALLPSGRRVEGVWHDGRIVLGSP